MSLLKSIRVLAITALIVLSGCASAPPAQVNNICGIFKEKGGLFDNWHKSMKKSQKKYGVPIPVMMATMHQESKFRAKAKPPRKKLLWVIPWKRASSAYGYAQVLNQTWNDYIQKSGNHGADRDKFKDAADFVGWYHAGSNAQIGISKYDTYNLYLAYHEGRGGFKRSTYKSKPWLMKVAKKVGRQAQTYQQQYQRCH